MIRVVEKFNINKQWETKGKLEIVRNMLAENEPVDKIMRITGLSREDVEKLQKEKN